MAKAAKPLKFVPPTEARLRRLIERGYFPSELPPPFTTTNFAQHAVELAAKWDGEKIRKYWTRPEIYSVPRYGHARRSLSVVNPVNQLHISDLVAKNWVAIRKRITRSTISEFDPKIILKGNGRAVTGVDFDGVARRRAEILGSFGRYVKTDIARFYPSIYTHSIPWAILGKAYVKSHTHDAAFKASFANLLDKAVAAGQQGQTIGIPIGPDTSRILSELIASEIEEIARSKVADLEHRAVRYVDDMLIGLHDTETPPAVLSAISAALYDFELELNAEKTVTNGLGCPHAPEWIHYVRTFELSSSEMRQRDDLDSFFEQALHLADANPRENVLLFSTKRAASFDVKNDNIAHLVRWLLYCARRSPSCLSFVAEHLAAMRSTKSMPHKEINSYILQQLPIKAEAAHTDEVAWLLFWAREIGLILPAPMVQKLTSLRSSAVGMLVLDLNQSGLVAGNVDFSSWKTSATVDGLRSELWLLAYEATKKGWWGKKQSDGFISGHQFFGDILSNEIEFYDQKKKARKKVKPVFLKVAMAAAVSGYPT